VNVEKLEIQDGDVLVLRGVKVGEEENVQALRDELFLRGYRDVLVIALADGATLERLDEAAMAEHGWVRAKR